MTNRFFQLLVSVFFVFLAFAFRVSAQSAFPLTLSRCLDLAARRSYAVQAEAQRLQAEEAAYQRARFQYLPQLSGELTHNELKYQPYRFPQQFQLLNAEWALGNWLYGAAQSEALRTKAQKLLLEQRRLEAARRAGALYLAILKKEARLAIFKERKGLLERHLQIATALWQAGTTTQLDVLQTQSALKGIEEDLTRVRAEREGLRLELKRILGWPANGQLELKGPSANSDSLPKTPFFPEDSLTANPLLRAYKLLTQAELAVTAKTKAAAAPRILVSGGYVVDHDPTADGNYWLVSAGLQVPLTKWREVQLQRREIAARASATSLDEQEIRRQLRIQADRLQTELSKLQQTYWLQRQRLSLAQETYQFAEARYQAGLVTNLDYLQAQEHLTEVKVALESTRLDYLRALLDYYALFNRQDLMRKLDRNL